MGAAKKQKPLSEVDKEFNRGFACAIACLVRYHDEPTVARDICHMNGLDLRDFQRAELEEFDMRMVRKAFRS